MLTHWSYVFLALTHRHYFPTILHITSSIMFPANPLLFWFSSHMFLWGSISFNFIVLINLLVAFFYPFSGNTGGNYGNQSTWLFHILSLFAANFLLFWFSSKSRYWGNSAFYLAVVINIVVGIFYPFSNGTGGKVLWILPPTLGCSQWHLVLETGTKISWCPTPTCLLLFHELTHWLQGPV